MALGPHQSGIMVMVYEAMSWLFYCYIMVMLWLPLWLLRQPGERLCSGCHASQKRINKPAVPMAPQISFQPLSSCLAYPGFSEQYGQCEQLWDNWCYKQDDQQYTHACISINKTERRYTKYVLCVSNPAMDCYICP